MLQMAAHRRRAAAMAIAVAGAATVTAPATAQATTVPDFISSCAFSHRAADDPIVMPGMDGMAMMHDFFGNTTTNASSTPSTLVAAGTTTCGATKDASAYWLPTVTLNGQEVMPTRMRIYYRVGTKASSTIKPIPVGLRMVAGNPDATSYQSTRVVSWGCGVASTGTAAVPTCSSNTLVLHVYFPDCWDGVHLDSADHHSHMAYTHNGACPADHPVPLPKITEDVQYPIRGGSGVQFEYSSSAKTGHADFMNGWNQATLASLVTKCLVGRVACGVISD